MRWLRQKMQSRKTKKLASRRRLHTGRVAPLGGLAVGSGRPQAMAAMWLTVSSAIATKSRSSWVRASYAADYSRLSAWKNEHQVKPKPYMTYNIYIYICFVCVCVNTFAQIFTYTDGNCLSSRALLSIGATARSKRVAATWEFIRAGPNGSATSVTSSPAGHGAFPSNSELRIENRQTPKFHRSFPNCIYIVQIVF